MTDLKRGRTFGADRGGGSAAVGGGRANMAYEHILERLRSGVYKPGERLNVGTISAELGISRHPIMVAMQQLSSEYLIQIIPQVGCVPAVYSKEEWIEFGRYFASCEALITQIAAEKAKTDDIENLRLISRNMLRILENGSNSNVEAQIYRDLNIDFHRFIHKMSRSKILDKRLVSLWKLADYFHFAVNEVRGFKIRVSLAAQEHEAICDAIAASDPLKARRLMEEHVLEQFVHGIP